MSKPEDVTDEAWDAAKDVNDALWAIATSEERHQQDNAVIARAIMAAEKRGEEREREAILSEAERIKADRRKLQREEETSADPDHEQAAILGGQVFMLRCMADFIRARST